MIVRLKARIVRTMRDWTFEFQFYDSPIKRQLKVVEQVSV